ncbi:hypothetical protein [Streptomyces chartreusis]
MRRYVDAGELLKEAKAVGGRGRLPLICGERVPLCWSGVGEELRGEVAQEAAAVLRTPSGAGNVEVDFGGIALAVVGNAYERIEVFLLDYG